MRYVPKKLVITADISRGKSSYLELFKLVVGVGLAAICAFTLLGFAADLVADRIPERLEMKMGFHLDSKIRETDSLYPQYQRTEELFQALSTKSGLRPLNYRLVFLDIPTPNAVAVPGGVVGVTRGLLNLVKSDEGLAMVLGHELGHHQSRHVLKSLGRSLLWISAISIFMEGYAVDSAQYLVQMFSASHSREQEYEADRIGFKLAKKQLGTADSYLEFFEKVHANYEEGESQWGDLFRSHPYTLDRIRRLKSMMKDVSSEDIR